MKDNPFVLMFGKEPYVTIPRDQIASEIIGDFSKSIPSSQIYVLLGARGAGKTVLLSEIYKKIDGEKDWIAVDVNPHRDILPDLASILYDKGKMKRLFLKGSLGISFQGLTFSIEGGSPVTSVTTVVERMLEHMAKKGKRLLITLDEVTSGEKVKEFAHDFQSFVRKGFPVYLLMTGLHENVMSLQNDKSLTFLYRAPKILLRPLDSTAVKSSYVKALGVDDKTANELASLCKGYGFGYQLLGYLYFRHGKIDDELLEEFDYQLRINAYDKIWSSVSENGRKIVKVLCEADEVSVASILTQTGFEDKEFSVYRDRLLQKGVVISKRRGYLSLALPRFDVFVSQN